MANPVLHRWHVDLLGNDTWTEITNRVHGTAVLTEGRNIASIGGPPPPPRCSAMQMTLSNEGGYFTIGAGAMLGPASRIRLQWRATSGDAWTTRFLGLFSEGNLATDQQIPLYQVRWVGYLWRVTSGNVPGRNLIEHTVNEMLDVVFNVAGIPAAFRNFDAATGDHNRAIAAGYQGIADIAAIDGSFVYDGPDGRVRREDPDVRAAGAVGGRYTDGIPAAAELGIPAPQLLTRPFGIVNHVDGQLQVFSPDPSTGGLYDAVLGTTLFFVPTAHQVWQTFTFTIDVPDTEDIISVNSFTMRVFSVQGSQTHFNDFEDIMDDGTYTINSNQNQVVVDIRNTAVTLPCPGQVLFTFEGRTRLAVASIRIQATATKAVLNRRQVFDLHATYPRSEADMSSQMRYGYRPRPSPIVDSLRLDSAPANDYAPAEADYAGLDAALDAELARYASPTPVYATRHASGTVAERADILARRLSDKVQLRCPDDGAAMLGINTLAYVEAMETRIDPFGNVRQTRYLAAVEGLPFPPAGLTATATGFTSIRLDWDRHADDGVTGYNVYRGDSEDAYALLAGPIGNREATTYTDPTVTDGQTYYYRIAARYLSVVGSISEVVSATA